VQALLRSFFTKAGLDVAKLDQMLGQIQGDEREAFEKLAAEAATYSARDQQAPRRALAERRKTLQLLNTIPIIPPAGPSRIVLDRPRSAPRRMCVARHVGLALAHGHG
jgi:hypothetical protein